MFGGVQDRDAFTVNPIMLRPRSRGQVRLRSANPFHWPLLYANYYQDEEDVRVFVEGLKLVSAPHVNIAFASQCSSCRPSDFYATP